MVDAFLAAAHGGDLATLLLLLAPDAVMRADLVGQQMGTPPEFAGADAVAARFNGGKGALPATIDGEFGAAWIHAGTVKVVFAFHVEDGLVREIELIADPEVLATMDIGPNVTPSLRVDRRRRMSKATKVDAPSPHIADRQDVIRVHGARENNLKDISIEIPKRRLTVVTGVSGSGKSSLVFGTIAAESQRLINETYSAFVQGFMPTLARPQVDVLEGLTTAIVVDQQRMGGDARSTVGTATDANAMLRILFSRIGKPDIGSPNAFSFNVAAVTARGAMTIERGAGKTVRKTFSRAGGMCARCEGRGTVSDMDLTQLFDDSKSLAEGAIIIPGYTVDNFFAVRPYLEAGILDSDKPINKYTKKERHDFLHHDPIKVKVNGVNVTYEGADPQNRAFDAVAGPRDAAITYPSVCRPGGHLWLVPRLRRHPAERNGPVVADRQGQHRRCLRDADQ